MESSRTQSLFETLTEVRVQSEDEELCWFKKRPELLERIKKGKEAADYQRLALFDLIPNGVLSNVH